MGQTQIESGSQMPSAFHFVRVNQKPRHIKVRVEQIKGCSTKSGSIPVASLIRRRWPVFMTISVIFLRFDYVICRFDAWTWVG